MDKPQDPKSDKPVKTPASKTPVDPVEESSNESFPASDAPSWNSGHEEEVPRKRGKTA